jgi:hypothetical protein
MVSVREVLIGLKKKCLDIEGNLAKPDFIIRMEFNSWFVLKIEEMLRKGP